MKRVLVMTLVFVLLLGITAVAVDLIPPAHTNVSVWSTDAGVEIDSVAAGSLLVISVACGEYISTVKYKGPDGIIWEKDYSDKKTEKTIELIQPSKPGDYTVSAHGTLSWTTSGFYDFTVYGEEVPSTGEEICSGDFEYRVDNDGNATVVGYSGTWKELVIPNEIDGYPVTNIGYVHVPSYKNAIEGFPIFSGDDNLISVAIPSSVRQIANRAFSDCKSLSSIIINSPDVEIEYNFDDNWGSTSLCHDSAFYNCPNLVDIRGYAESTAEFFARKNSKRFVPMIKVLFDETILTCDEPPQIIGGRILVPMSVIFDALGCGVEWIENTKMINASKMDDDLVLRSVNMKIGSINMVTYTIDRSIEPPVTEFWDILLDTPPVLTTGIVLVPIRAVSEAFGATVEWDRDTETVTVVTM